MPSNTGRTTRPGCGSGGRVRSCATLAGRFATRTLVPSPSRSNATPNRACSSSVCTQREAGSPARKNSTLRLELPPGLLRRTLAARSLSFASRVSIVPTSSHESSNGTVGSDETKTRIGTVVTVDAPQPAPKGQPADQAAAVRPCPQACSELSRQVRERATWAVPVLPRSPGHHQLLGGVMTLRGHSSDDGSVRSRRVTRKRARTWALPSYRGIRPARAAASTQRRLITSNASFGNECKHALRHHRLGVPLRSQDHQPSCSFVALSIELQRSPRRLRRA